jgi:uncharacterized protein Smg (DUF494 family)
VNNPSNDVNIMDKKAIKKQMKDAGFSDAEITRVLARYRKRNQYRREGRKERQ